MDLFEVLEKRYSCREYLSRDVNDLDLSKILNYASFSPSAGNLQQWNLIVVKSKEKRESLAIASLNQSWMSQAPVHLVVLGNEEYVKKFYKIRGELYCKQDCAAFIQSILLIATDLGIDSCWVGAFDNEMLKRELEIPDNLVPYAIITLGYGKEKNPNHKNRYDINTFTFFEKYGNRSKDNSLLPLEKYVPEIQEKSKNIFSKLKVLIKHPK